MAKPEQLPSGLWSMRIRLPDGRRPRITHELRSVVIKLAGEAQADAARDDWIDPRDSATKVAVLWERAQRTWVVADATWSRYRSTWRKHADAKWSRWSVGKIFKPDVTEWVNELAAAGCDPTTIEHCVTLIRKLLELAVDLKMVRANAARGVGTPSRNVVDERVLTLTEEEAILDALDLHWPGRIDARPFAEVLLDTGGRWQDAAGLIRSNIDTVSGMVHITGVMQRDGTRRSTLKTEGGEITRGRHVVLMESTLERLRGRLSMIGPGDLVFVAAEGKGLHYQNWRNRIWDRAVMRARLCGGVLDDCDVRAVRPSPKHKPGPAFCQNAEHGLPTPLPTPHVTRHTFGTRLAEDGAPIHEIQALMGHKSRKSTERYIHAGDTRFDRARNMRKRSAS